MGFDPCYLVCVIFSLVIATAIFIINKQLLNEFSKPKCVIK